MKKYTLLPVIVLLLLNPVMKRVQAEVSGESDDGTALTVNCSGLGRSWDDCYQEAASLCPKGYDILKKSTGVVSTPVLGQHTLAPGKKLVIECNKVAQ